MKKERSQESEARSQNGNLKAANHKGTKAQSFIQRDWSKVKPNDLWKAGVKVLPYNARTKIQIRAAQADKRRREPYGDYRFWQLFYMLYLNRNCLYISQAYKIAVKKFSAENQFAQIPTLHQVKYKIRQLDPAKVNLARYGQTELAKAVEGYIEPEGE